jgi:MFS family permease
MRRLWPLLLLNFFMADMQSGIGPFVGVFLLEQGWQSGLIGTAITFGNVAGMLVTIPIGAFIDATNYKRSWVILPGICVVLASAIILLSQQFWVVATSQIATSIAGAAIVPAVTGITLGIVKQKGFNRQIGKTRRSTTRAIWLEPRCPVFSAGASATPPFFSLPQCLELSRSCAC